MDPTDTDPYRYGENDSRPPFLNWDHYRQAHRTIAELTKRISVDRPTQNSHEGTIRKVPIELLRISEENRLLPIDGYFSFFSDLLGFSKEVHQGGMDCLPDFYGGALVASVANPAVKVYLISDSCFGFAPADRGPEFIRFVSLIVSRWLGNGLIPQCAIGYGSFVERAPFSDQRPPNFFGIQVTGTALADAAGFLKDKRPFGSRILVTPTAWLNWPLKDLASTGLDGNGNREFFLERTSQGQLFDCVYYLLCLRDHELDSRAFNHYVWSFASRAAKAKRGIPKLAVSLAAPHCKDVDLETIIYKIDEVLKLYESA